MKTNLCTSIKIHLLKMNYAFLIMQFFVIVSCTEYSPRSAKDQETLRRANLKIKSCLWYKYTFKKEEIDSSTRKLFGMIYYNKQGNEILRYNFNLIGDTIFTQKTIYNSQNVPVEQITLNLHSIYNKIKSTQARTFYIYNANKCIKEKLVSNSSADTGYISHEYFNNKIITKIQAKPEYYYLNEKILDSEENTIEESFYVVQGDSKEKATFTKYRYINNLLWTEEDQEGNTEIQYDYNSNALLEKQIFYDSINKPQQMYLYQYVR